MGAKIQRRMIKASQKVRRCDNMAASQSAGWNMIALPRRGEEQRGEDWWDNSLMLHNMITFQDPFEVQRSDLLLRVKKSACLLDNTGA